MAVAGVREPGGNVCIRITMTWAQHTVTVSGGRLRALSAFTHARPQNWRKTLPLGYHASSSALLQSMPAGSHLGPT